MSLKGVPKGFSFAGLASGIKKNGSLDLGLIVSDPVADCTGVFTQNKVVAAPVRLTRPVTRAGRCAAILVNSGNANACTGTQGLNTAEQTAQQLASLLKLERDQIALASTGVIGVQLPLEPFTQHLPQLVAGLNTDNAEVVAEAIRTTDAFVKISAVGDDNHPYRILGLAKGAGMIHPNMGTMLCFVMTDAKVDPDFLKAVLSRGVNKSFNSITVDGDTSTNDTVLLLANGAADGDLITANSPEADHFVQELEQVLLDLAKMIVQDGEGSTKLVEIKVTGATNEADAKTVARSIATSSLVKTAFFGEDANWGRIITAAGYAGVDIDPDLVDISFDDIAVARAGMAVPDLDEEAATAVLRQSQYAVIVDLHQGEAVSSYYTSDLGYEYIKINADYRT
jgi:glutamate N-acetyltransferase/amino-acid N-acetyltransferase